MSKTAIGYVEGIFDGDVMGWICNKDAPDDAPQEILVSSDLNHWTSFGAHVPRPDVSEAMGQARVYGFAIPLQLLPRYRREVYFRNPSGSLLTNGTIAPECGQDAAEQGPRYLMIHIPKTAGTSLRHFFESSYKHSQCCWIYEEENYTSTARFHKLSIAQRGHFRLAMGHVPTSFAYHLPGDVRFLTFLRDPMERMKSHVWHHLRHVDMHIDGENGKLDLVEAVNEGLAVGFDNAQIRLIGDISKQYHPKIQRHHVFHAIRALCESFDFVGITEDIETDFVKLSQLLNLPSRQLPRENVKPEKPDARAQEIFDSIDWARVEERHAADRELYDWVKKNGNWLNERYKGAALLRAHNSSL